MDPRHPVVIAGERGRARVPPLRTTGVAAAVISGRRRHPGPPSSSRACRGISFSSRLLDSSTPRLARDGEGVAGRGQSSRGAASVPAVARSRADERRRVPAQVALRRAHRAGGGAAAFPRPVRAGRRGVAGRGGPGGALLRLRAAGGQDRRRHRLRGRVPQGPLRDGVQGARGRPRPGVPAVAPVPGRPRQPAAAGRLRHPPHRHPHQFHPRAQEDDRTGPRRHRRAGGAARAAGAVLRPGPAPPAGDRRRGDAGGGRARGGRRPAAGSARDRPPAGGPLPRAGAVLPVRRGRPHPAGAAVLAAAGAPPPPPGGIRRQRGRAVRRDARRRLHLAGIGPALQRRPLTRSTCCRANWRRSTRPRRWTGRPSNRRSSARCSSARWTRTSGRGWARTTPTATTSCG